MRTNWLKTFLFEQAYPAIGQWGCSYHNVDLIQFFPLDLTELFIVLQLFCNHLYFFVRRCWTFCKERLLNLLILNWIELSWKLSTTTQEKNRAIIIVVVIIIIIVVSTGAACIHASFSTCCIHLKTKSRHFDSKSTHWIFQQIPSLEALALVSRAPSSVPQLKHHIHIRPSHPGKVIITGSTWTVLKSV